MFKKTIAIATISLLAATSATAHSIKPVRDFRGNFAEDFRGNCLRTKWVSEHDECGFGAAPAAAPAPEQPNLIQAQINYIDLIRQSVYFNIDKHNIDADDINRMNQVISEVNNSNGVQSVKLVGYADKFANYGYNQRLSDKRVANVIKYFKSEGYFTSGNVTSAFYGDTKPVTNCDANLPKSQLVECRATDRRVDIEVELIRQKTEMVYPNDPRINQQFAPQVTIPASQKGLAAPIATTQTITTQAIVPAQAYAQPAANTQVLVDAKGRKLPKSMQPAYQGGFATQQVVTTTTTEVVPTTTTQRVITQTTTAPTNVVSGVDATDHLYPVYNATQAQTQAAVQAVQQQTVAPGAVPNLEQVAPVAPATPEETINQVDEMLNRKF